MPLALSNEKTNLIKIGLFCKRFSPPRKTFCNLKRSYQLPSHIPLPQNQICSKNLQKIDQLSYEQLADLPQLIDHKLLLPVEVEKERNAEKEKTGPPVNNLGLLVLINQTLEMGEANIFCKVPRHLMSPRVNNPITVERERERERETRGKRQPLK